jgi:23S rRNA pseudouridine2605 synthase
VGAGEDSSEGSADSIEGSAGERLQKVLARAGLGSRRRVEDLIRDGRVRVEGRLARLGDRVDPATESVSVDGVPVPLHPELRYYALNKPAGVTSTLSDPHAATTLAGFLPQGPRVFPVGRLDRESEGLMILTNDGELANRLQHPRYGVEREYLAEVEGSVTAPALRRLIEGVELEDGRGRARKAQIVERTRTRSAVSVVITEGRKHEVRRMLQLVGHPVLRLIRVRVGPLRLGPLPPGAVRALPLEEVSSLYAAARLPTARPRPRREPRPTPGHRKRTT